MAGLYSHLTLQQNLIVVPTAALCIQVHPGAASGMDLPTLREAAERLAKSVPGLHGVSFTEGEDKGSYINIVFSVESTAIAWEHIRTNLLDSTQFGATLRNSCLVVGTGEHGWNDYVLFHHYKRPQAGTLSSEASQETPSK